MQQWFPIADQGLTSSPVTGLSRELCPRSLSSDPVVDESVSPISYKTLSPCSKSPNPVPLLIENSSSVLEIWPFNEDAIPMSRVDSKIDDSSSFVPVMESSVDNLEEIPKPMFVTEKVKSTMMFIGLKIFVSYSKTIKMFQNCMIYYFLQADEGSRRDSRRKNRLRTTKKDDFL